MQAFFVKIPSSDGVLLSDEILTSVIRRIVKADDEDNNYERK